MVYKTAALALNMDGKCQPRHRLSWRFNVSPFSLAVVNLLLLSLLQVSSLPDNRGAHETPSFFCFAPFSTPTALPSSRLKTRLNGVRTLSYALSHQTMCPKC